MKKILFTILIALSVSVAYGGNEVIFDDWFENRTLRINYNFVGNNKTQELSVDELISFKVWAGRRHNLDSLYLAGNGQITMSDDATGKVIYRTSFSSLFQEWQNTEEATRVRKSFENVFLLPFPKKPVKIELTLCNSRRDVTSKLIHRVNPKDILIRNIDNASKYDYKYIVKSGTPEECIDVAIVAEGYTPSEMNKFYQRAEETADALFAHAPFKQYKNRFNIVAVAVPSKNSGVSIPKQNLWIETALDSHFDTFYSDRYLTTLHLKRLHDYLAFIPYEHIIILANTDNYGGGGIYNSYTLTAADHSMFKPVVVHEFGHSFGGLADEYYYDDQYEEMYPTDVEPWEKNITTLVDFSSKWKNLLPENVKIPTPPSNNEKDIYTKIGVYEGGGYQSKGVYRAFQECRMKINEAPAFCKVCQNVISNLITYYTE